VVLQPPEAVWVNGYHLMTTEPTEPTEPERPTNPDTGDGGLRPPRVLVSVEDLEDPADWDVVVVENDAIDDATALQIARRRTGRPGTNLPSLDERDIARAFQTDFDAEDPEGLSVDAFSPPAMARPARRRFPPPAPIDLPDDGFDDLALDLAAEAAANADQGPRPKPGVVAEVPVEEEPEVEPPADEAVFDLIDATVRRRPDTSPDELLLDDGDEPPEPMAAPPVAAPREEVGAEGAEDEVAAADPAPPTFDETVQIAADQVGPPPGEATTDEDEADGELAPAFPAFPDKAPVSVDLWGREADDPDRPVPALTSVQLEADAEEIEEEIEEEVEDALLIDSSFPIGPDDIRGDGTGAAIDVASLDYASVFGPVQGALPEPDLALPRTRRTATVGGDRIYGAHAVSAGLGELDDEYEDDDDQIWPVPARRRRGKRELVTLGIAAGLVLAIGFGMQLLGRSDRPTLVASDETTTTVGRTRSTSNTTSPTFTVTTEASVLPIDDTTDDSTTQPTRPRNTTPTTVKQAPPTPPPTQATTTTTEATTTTTEATTTTTTPPATTTTAP